MFGCILCVDLVCSYAEASHNNQILSLPQDSSGELSLGPYAYNVNVPDTISYVIVEGKNLMRYPTVFSLSTHLLAERTSGM